MKKEVKKIYSYSVFYEADPNGGYVVFAPAMPGCHTQGDTLEEAEKNIKEAIELYLESLVAHKERIPEEIKSFQGTVRVPIPLCA
ncbi:MAG: type II toxin-antitoxin system HicB family antitoxin [Patescibacteria group bacterium]